jgi:hypothetical protein
MLLRKRSRSQHGRLRHNPATIGAESRSDDRLSIALLGTTLCALRIPTKRDTYSNLKPDSVPIPVSTPRLMSQSRIVRSKSISVPLGEVRLTKAYLEAEARRPSGNTHSAVTAVWNAPRGGRSRHRPPGTNQHSSTNRSCAPVSRFPPSILSMGSGNRKRRQLPCRTVINCATSTLYLSMA